MTDFEQYDLPSGWVWTTLSQLEGKGSTSIEPAKYPDEEFESYSVPIFDTGKPEIVEGKTVGSNKQIVQEDTVLLCKINPRINRVWVVGNYSHHRKIASTEWITYPKQEGILPKYLCYFLQNSDFRNFLSANVSGVGGSLMRVRRATFANYPIPIPPPAEQARIVEAIESQLSRIEAGVAAARRAQQALRRYKASVLNAACTGRLLPQDEQDEPADVLLQRILTERRARWEAEQLQKYEAQGKTPPKGWQDKYPVPAAPDTSDLTELPHGWVWANLGQAFRVYVGATPSRKMNEYWKGEIPWVSSGEVAFCRIKDTREKITDLGLENTSTSIHPVGTVLIGMIGEGKTRGQVAILDIPASHNQNSGAIRVSETEVLPEYVYNFLESTYEKTRRDSSGNNQLALNKARVEAMNFPLPPLAEQERIVAEVERRLSVVAALEHTVSATLTRAARLRQGVLRRAFRGELVAQDPTDEGAVDLLKREDGAYTLRMDMIDSY